MNSSPGVAPFQIVYSPHIPELLQQLNTTLVYSTYQAGKLVFLSPVGTEKLVQLPRTFNKPMGFGFHSDGQKMALATADEVIVFANSPSLAQHYPRSPEKYDALFVPRMTLYTGALDVHDLHWGADDKLYGVNTLFSCLCTFDSNYNFTPYWTPPQITEMASEDRCHLNGLALKNGTPKYATAFNRGNTAQSWRENINETGVVWDIDENAIIAEGLGMPHSPNLYDGELYVLTSANGELIKINPSTGSKEVVFQMDAFLRGMTKVGDYLFIAHSKLRQNSSTFAQLDISKKANRSGIVVLHLPSKSIQGEIQYQSSVDEIYEIHALPNVLRPNILNTKKEDHKLSLMTPDATYWAKNQER